MSVHGKVRHPHCHCWQICKQIYWIMCFRWWCVLKISSNLICGWIPRCISVIARLRFISRCTCFCWLPLGTCPNWSELCIIHNAVQLCIWCKKICPRVDGRNVCKITVISFVYFFTKENTHQSTFQFTHQCKCPWVMSLFSSEWKLWIKLPFHVRFSNISLKVCVSRLTFVLSRKHFVHIAYKVLLNKC